MITDINQKSTVTALNRSKLPSYWMQYFEYEKDEELFELTKSALIKAITEIKKEIKPFVDSQIVISKILTDFGTKSLFHRKFNERHSRLHREQVLGMQLYNIMLEDNEIWIYLETQHSGHTFPHATYFMSKN